MGKNNKKKENEKVDIFVYKGIVYNRKEMSMKKQEKLGIDIFGSSIAAPSYGRHRLLPVSTSYNPEKVNCMNIDQELFQSYVSVTKDKYTENTWKSMFRGDKDTKRLILWTFNTSRETMNADYYTKQIVDNIFMYDMHFSMFKSPTFEFVSELTNEKVMFVLDRFHKDVKHTNGYWKVKGPGLPLIDGVTSRAIVDNACAVYRVLAGVPQSILMEKYNKDLKQHDGSGVVTNRIRALDDFASEKNKVLNRMLSGVTENTDCVKINDLRLAKLMYLAKRCPELIKADNVCRWLLNFDIRKCLLGDLQYLSTGSDNPIYYFMVDHSTENPKDKGKLYKDYFIPHNITADFGKQVWVVTNPANFVLYDEYGVTLTGIKNCLNSTKDTTEDIETPLYQIKFKNRGPESTDIGQQ